MSYRSSFSQPYRGGRASPLVPRLGQLDRSFSELFEYVDPSETRPRHEEPLPAAIPVESESDPDVLHIKYMGQPYTLSFPAYSISESGVTVQEVRRRMAEKLHEDPRRVRLVYKDRELRYDPYPIKRYGCKQNSELMVVVTESLNDWSGYENHQSSEEDSGSSTSLRPPEHRRPRGLSTVRHREEKRHSTSNADTNGFLHPSGYSRSETPNRRTASPSRYKESTHRSNERVAESSRYTPSPAPASTPPPRRVPADSSTPLGKVHILQDQFYDKWLKEAQDFLDAPPSDATQKEREYRKVSENVMKHIIEAADAIELQGDQNARAERKKLLGDAQKILTRLDAVQKR